MKHSIPHLPDDYQLDILKNITGGNPALMKRLLDTFLSSAGSNSELLAQALQQKDYSLASETAHKLTPQARHLGLESLSQDFKLIDKQHEELVKEGRWESVTESAILRIKAVIEAVKVDVGEM